MIAEATNGLPLERPKTTRDARIGRKSGNLSIGVRAMTQHQSGFTRSDPAPASRIRDIRARHDRVDVRPELRD